MIKRTHSPVGLEPTHISINLSSSKVDSEFESEESKDKVPFITGGYQKIKFVNGLKKIPVKVRNGSISFVYSTAMMWPLIGLAASREVAYWIKLDFVDEVLKTSRMGKEFMRHSFDGHLC